MPNFLIESKMNNSLIVFVVFGTGLHRRNLGNNFDERLKVTHSNFVVTADNRFIIAVGFWDKSFRVFNAESGENIYLSQNPLSRFSVICVKINYFICINLWTILLFQIGSYMVYFHAVESELHIVLNAYTCTSIQIGPTLAE